MIIPTTSQLFIYKLTLSLKVLLTKTTLLGLLFLLTITFSYISCCLSYQNLWTLWLSIYIYTISIRLNIKLYGMFVACGIWCLADVSSVSPSSEQTKG